MTLPCNSSSSSGSRASMRPSGMSRRRQRALGALVQWTMAARGAPSRPRRHTKPAPYRLVLQPLDPRLRPRGEMPLLLQNGVSRRTAAIALITIAFAIEPLLFAASTFVFWCFGAEIFLAHHKLVMIGLHNPDATPNDAPQALVHSDGIQLQEPGIHKSVHGPGISCICRVYPARRDVR
ncbi:hypothetical protein EDB80DRAFT_678931 [Ilyonectria destructans]|nr:hypothetical protein EDB80DRAFT_678931 [Ilyonectria destructans]